MVNEIGILTNVFKEKDYLPGCIKQFSQYNLHHIVLANTKSWHGEYQNDDSAALAETLGAETYQSAWPTEAEQFNFGLERLQQIGCSWALIVDADERYLQSDIKLLKKEITACDSQDFGIIRTRQMKVFWKSPDYIMPHDTGNGPIIATRTNHRFTHARSIPSLNIYFSAVTLYHFSYVRNDEAMLKKIRTFSHANEFDVESWYKNVWLKWTPEMRNLHPTIPNSHPVALYAPEECPEEIRKLL